MPRRRSSTPRQKVLKTGAATRVAKALVPRNIQQAATAIAQPTKQIAKAANIKAPDITPYITPVQKTKSSLFDKALGVQTTHAQPTMDFDDFIAQEGLDKPKESFLKRAGKGVGNFALGVGKSAFNTLSGGSELLYNYNPYTVSARVTAKALGLNDPKVEMPQLEAKGTAQKAGKFIGDVGQFFIPGSLGPRAASGLKGAQAASTGVKAAQSGKFLSKVARGSKQLLPKVARETTEATAITAAQEGGEINKNVGVTAATAGALPIAAAPIKKFFQPGRLMGKAMGLTANETKKISKVARTKNLQGGAIYDSIEDFALKNKLSGSRENMVSQAEDLLQKAKGSKKELLKGVTETTPNNYKEAFDHLQRVYDKPGLKDDLMSIKQLSRKKDLTAVELDKVRKYLDDSMGIAYTGNEKLQTKGIQKLVDPMRRDLEKLDKTGLIRKTNTDIRVLNKLVGQGSGSGALSKSASKNLANQLAFRGMTTGGATYVISQAVPELTPILTGIAAADQVLFNIPQVSSKLAQLIKSGSEKEANLMLAELLKALTKGTATEISRSKTLQPN